MALQEWQVDFVDQLKTLKEPPWDVLEAGRIVRWRDGCAAECPGSAVAMKKGGWAWIATGQLATIRAILQYSEYRLRTVISSADNTDTQWFNAEFRSAMLEALGIKEVSL